MQKIEAFAPAKVILSGEHAVLYGCPAIAAALNRCAKTTIIQTNETKKRLFIRLEDMKTHVCGTFSMFRRVRDRLLNSYKKFLTGQKSIRELLMHPAELFQFAMGTLIDSCYLEMQETLDIRLSSSIPVGCGMGSSAATIVSFIRALTHYFKVGRSIDWIEKLVFEIENLQHGRSSGLDTFVSLHGGAVYHEKGKKPISLESGAMHFLRSLPFWIVNTGRPESTTGECIEYVRKGQYGRENSSLWNEFRDVTQSIMTAIQDKSGDNLMNVLSRNQMLLTTLGVVPKKVASFVKKAEKYGAFVKTTGAGAMRGERGGILLGLGHMPPQALLTEYGYPPAQYIQLAFAGSGVVCA